MGKTKKEDELQRQKRQIHRLYALIWILGCPLAFVVARLLGFEQIHIVYWTLLVVPVLLGIYNVRQVPQSRSQVLREEKAACDSPVGEGVPSTNLEGGQQKELSPAVSTLERTRLLAQAVKLPVIVAFPLLVTVLVDWGIRLQK